MIAIALAGAVACVALVACLAGTAKTPRARTALGVLGALCGVAAPPVLLLSLSPAVGPVEWTCIVSACAAGIALLLYGASVRRVARQDALIAAAAVGVYAATYPSLQSAAAALFLGFFGGRYARSASLRVRVSLLAASVPAIVLPLVLLPITLPSAALAASLCAIALVSVVS